MQYRAIITLIIFLFLTSLLPLSQNIVSAQAVEFKIPDTNGKVIFAFQDWNMTYSDALLSNDTWHFKRLGSPYYKGDFSISVKNSTITLTHYNPMSQESKPQSIFNAGYLRYLVEGVGEQSFNMHFIWDIPVHWKVTIDDVERNQGDGWTFTDGWLTVKGATHKVAAGCIVDEAPNQSPIISGGQICYPLPELKANILFDKTLTFRESLPEFDPNATYRPPASAAYPYAAFFRAKQTNLPNAPWFLFSNIVLGDKDLQGTGRVAVTAKNSNITFTAVDSSNNVISDKRAKTDCWLNFSVAGVGEQSVALFSAMGGDNMTVIIDGTQRKEGDGWKIQRDESGIGWLTISNAKTSVSIYSSNIHYFGPSLVFEPDHTLVYIGGVVTILVLTILWTTKKLRHKPKHQRILSP